jgi:hypothetical protein
MSLGDGCADLSLVLPGVHEPPPNARWCCEPHLRRMQRRRPLRTLVRPPALLHAELAVPRLWLPPLEHWDVAQTLVLFDACNLRKYEALVRRHALDGLMLAECARSVAALSQLLELAGHGDTEPRRAAEAMHIQSALRAHAIPEN